MSKYRQKNAYSGRVLTESSFNRGRKAGMGILYDDYSDEAKPDSGMRRPHSVRFPHDGCNTEDLNGPVIIIQEARAK